jgi:uncharacterized protein (TIGR02246 family)
MDVGRQEDDMANKQAFTSLVPTFAKAFNRGDTAGIAALFARDALRLTPNGPIMKGRKAIEANSAEAIKSGQKNIKFTAIRGGSDGNLAYHVGRFAVDVPTAGGTRKERGKYVDIYKRQKNGSWKIAVTIYNSDLPVAK